MVSSKSNEKSQTVVLKFLLYDPTGSKQKSLKEKFALGFEMVATVMSSVLCVSLII